MKVDFSTPIHDIHGKPVRIDDTAMTIGSCCLSALQHMFPNEDISVEVKVRRFKLAVRIAQADEPLAIGNDDVSELKAVVGKFWNPLVVGRVLEVIDPEGMEAL